MTASEQADVLVRAAEVGFFRDAYAEWHFAREDRRARSETFAEEASALLGEPVLFECPFWIPDLDAGLSRKVSEAVFIDWHGAGGWRK